MDLILFLGIFIVVLVLTQALFMFIRSRFNPEVVRLKREIVDPLGGAATAQAGSTSSRRGP